MYLFSFYFWIDHLGVNNEYQENSPAEATKTYRQNSEHQNIATPWKNKMGARSLEVELQHPRMEVGAGSLEQIVSGVHYGKLQKS